MNGGWTAEEGPQGTGDEVGVVAYIDCLILRKDVRGQPWLVFPKRFEI